MALPAAILVEGVLAQLPAVAHMVSTDARPTATVRGTGLHGQCRIRRDPPLRKASALEPQRLSRRRFPLSTPFGVARGVKRTLTASFATSCHCWPTLKGSRQ